MYKVMSQSDLEVRAAMDKGIRKNGLEVGLTIMEEDGWTLVAVNQSAVTKTAMHYLHKP